MSKIILTDAYDSLTAMLNIDPAENELILNVKLGGGPVVSRFVETIKAIPPHIKTLKLFMTIKPSSITNVDDIVKIFKAIPDHVQSVSLGGEFLNIADNGADYVKIIAAIPEKALVNVSAIPIMGHHYYASSVRKSNELFENPIEFEIDPLEVEHKFYKFEKTIPGNQALTLRDILKNDRMFDSYFGPMPTFRVRLARMAERLSNILSAGLIVSSVLAMAVVSLTSPLILPLIGAGVAFMGLAMLIPVASAMVALIQNRRDCASYTDTFLRVIQHVDVPDEVKHQSLLSRFAGSKKYDSLLTDVLSGSPDVTARAMNVVGMLGKTSFDYAVGFVFDLTNHAFGETSKGNAAEANRILELINIFLQKMPEVDRGKVVAVALKNLPVFDVDKDIDAYPKSVKSVLKKLLIYVDQKSLDELVGASDRAVVQEMSLERENKPTKESVVQEKKESEALIKAVAENRTTGRYARFFESHKDVGEKDESQPSNKLRPR